MFVGRDCTRAFALSNFTIIQDIYHTTSKDAQVSGDTFLQILNDRLSYVGDLNDVHLQLAHRWLRYFHNQPLYRFVGVLQGHYYDSNGMKTHIWSRIGQGEKSNAEYLLTKHVIESIDNKSASIFSLPSCKSFYSPSSGHTLYCSQYFLPKHDPLSLFQKAKVSKMFNTESVDAAASRKGAPGSLFTNSDLSNLYRKLQLAPDPLPPPRLPRDVFIQLDPSQPQRDHHCICVTQEQIDAIEKSTTMHSEALDGCDTTSLLCRVKPTESVLLYHRQHQHDNSHRKQYKEVDNVVNITDSIHPGYTDNTASIPRAFTVPTTRTRIRR
uniref:Neuferricin n=1 Tax=Lygus hesperus TaxID=30085 RepID=A0A0A9VVE7_LYGHE